MAFHPDAYDGKLADVVGGDHFAEPDLRFQAVDHFARLEEVGFVYGERQVRGGPAAAVADVLHDHVDIDTGIPDGLKDAGGDAGLVGHRDQGDLGLVFVERHAAHDDIFHVPGLFFHNGSWVII